MGRGEKNQGKGKEKNYKKKGTHGGAQWHLIFLGSMSRVSHPRLGFNWRILVNWGLFLLCTMILSCCVLGAVPLRSPAHPSTCSCHQLGPGVMECLFLKFSCLSEPALMRGEGILISPSQGRARHCRCHSTSWPKSPLLSPLLKGF